VKDTPRLKKFDPEPLVALSPKRLSADSSGKFLFFSLLALFLGPPEHLSYGALGVAMLRNNLNPSITA
jgi:hypothetical protein